MKIWKPVSKIILLVTLLFYDTSHAYNYNDWNNDVEDSGYDWALHITGGAIVSGVTIGLLPDDWNRWIRYISGIAAAFAVGGGIELLDKNFDYDDWRQWGYGGVGGAVIMMTWEVDWSTMTFK